MAQGRSSARGEMGRWRQKSGHRSGRGDEGPSRRARQRQRFGEITGTAAPFWRRITDGRLQRSGRPKAVATPVAGADMNRVTMDRFIDTIEWIAAGFVGIVAADIFISVLLRNLFGYAIPDAFDFGRLLLGILIFWGIAATSYRGGHITVDLVWANVGPRYQRMIDVFATLVLLFVVTVQTYTLFDKVRGTYYDHVLTFDLRL